jgi:hypothetical protein
MESDYEVFLSGYRRNGYQNIKKGKSTSFGRNSRKAANPGSDGLSDLSEKEGTGEGS